MPVPFDGELLDKLDPRVDLLVNNLLFWLSRKIELALVDCVRVAVILIIDDLTLQLMILFGEF